MGKRQDKMYVCHVLRCTALLVLFVSIFAALVLLINYDIDSDQLKRKKNFLRSNRISKSLWITHTKKN